MMEQLEIDRGRERRARAQGARHADLQQALGAIDPRLATWADGWIFGNVWDDEVDFHDRMIVAIVALASTGKTQQLKNYLHGALQDGMPPRRIHESLMMLPVYVGFPTAIAALALWQEVVQASRRRGMDIELPIQ
jgi:4-carboxymuconolactone decarboxylase